MPQAHREADQTEKAYQKQDAVFLGRKRTLAKNCLLYTSPSPRDRG